MNVWQANERADDNAFQDFAHSMLNISSQFRAYRGDLPGLLRNLIGVSASVSVELRKQLIGGGLLRRCVRQPRLHRLKPRDQLVGDPVEHCVKVHGGQVTITKLDEPGAGETLDLAIAPQIYEVVVHPLHGLCFENEYRWVSENPFDWTLGPYRLRRWLKQPVLRLDSDQFDLKTLIAEVANTQGAHADRRNDLIRKQISRHFQSVYLNMFALHVAVELSNQFATSVLAKSSLYDRIARVYPEILEDLYEVAIKLEFGRDSFFPHAEFPLRFEIPQEANSGNLGVHPIGSTAHSTRIEISAP